MKKIVTMLLSILLVLGLLPKEEALAASFTDVTNYQDEINYLVSKKVINGYPDGSFKPLNNLTRMHAVTMILREKGITDLTAPDPGFTDVKPGTKGYEEVAKAVQLGFISGKNAANGTKYFDPQGTLTRGQMAKILVLGYGLPINNNYSFTDVTADNGFKSQISTLASQNITTGYEDGSFKPNGKITRQHFAVFMARLLNESFKPKPAPASKKMYAHFIDVGQGDSILLQTPNNKTMLIDGGTKAAGSKVVSFLKSKGITKLDYVVATHPDADHIGGLIEVLKNFKVTNFIDPGKTHTTQTYLELMKLVDTKGINYTIATTGSKITIDSSIGVQVLHANKNASDSNDASIVLKATYNKVSFLLMGDASTELESTIMAKYDVKATVLKAGHHGSNTGSSAKFISKVNPASTILSYGKDNSYGHPHKEVVTRLKNVGSKIYSTANSGTITVMTNGTTHTVSAKEWTGTGTGSSTGSGSGSTTTPTTPTTSSNVKIVSKDLSAEIVGIKNNGSTSVNLQGWKLVSVEGNQSYTFGSYTLGAGKTVYVTSGPNAKTGTSYLKWTGSAIWNNSGDAAKLYNASGKLVSEMK